MKYCEELNGNFFEFYTKEMLFSPKHIDKGTRLLLEELSLKKDDKVLDIGCGYGVIGIYCAKIIPPQNVFMCDISSHAICCAKKNIVVNNVKDVNVVLSDGLNKIKDNDFTIIISNPPYHTDFSVAKHFIEDSFYKLRLEGKIYLVTKRKDWYKNKLISVFGGVKILEKDGYYIFCSEKRSNKPCYKSKRKEKNKPTLSKKLRRKIKNEKNTSI